MKTQVNKTCKNCHKGFRVKPSLVGTRKFCSRDCYFSFSFERKTKDCKYCGDSFSECDSVLEKRKFCSLICASYWQAKNHIPKMELCTFCSKQFKHNSSSKNLYCSRECHVKDIKRVFPNCLDCDKQLSSLKSIRCMVCRGLCKTGVNHPNWIEDRTQLKDDSKERGGQLHREWSKSVKNRDGQRCQISNNDCSGRLEAHHILNWMEHPKLRYEVNNGITLCVAHHPRKRNDEKRLTSFYTSLVLNR